MDLELQRAVRTRLAGAVLDDDVRQSVVAACMEVPLDQAETAEWTPVDDDTDSAQTRIGGVFLDGITVRGFRGIGPARRLDLSPGPGLTVVVGRNGSGKSSFAEGLEMALTGTSHRWEGKLKVWRETWRNLHDGDHAAIEVDLVLPPDGTTTVEHVWATDAGLEEGTTTLADGRPLSALGWHDALVQYRPLLSFAELGGMFDGKQSELHDAIAAILGVEAVTDAVEVLRQTRLEGSKPLKQSKKDLPALVTQLRESNDERTDKVLAALEGRTWDLAGALRALEDEDSADPASELARLRQLASLEAPSPVDARAAAQRLRTAVETRDAATATDAAQADRLATLLHRAIDHVTADGPLPCPLCESGTVLDDDWVTQAQEQATALADQAAAVRQADTQLAAARRQAVALTAPPPEALEMAHLVGLDAAPVTAAWQALHALPADDPAALTAQLEAAVQDVHDTIAAFRKTTSATIDAYQEDWRPLARTVTRWVEDARAAQSADLRSKRAEQGEKWLRAVAQEIQAERFQPVRTAVQSYWDQLKLQSNVDLRDLSLAGSSTTRRLQLDVAVDDSAASALGVMSQGELHALALAVFLPRATLDASPFRFVVLDDPVQAMDPAKVDGLAGVLAEVAATRQVVVFTHDTRLPNAIRDLQIPATILEVHRGINSDVALRAADDPVERYLSDVYVVTRTEGINDKVKLQLIRQMGRGALEAASVQIVRRRRLTRGDTHESVEQALEDSKGLHNLLTLALWDDERRSGDLYGSLSRWDGAYVDVVKTCKEGHLQAGEEVDPAAFHKDLKHLIARVRREAI